MPDKPVILLVDDSEDDVSLIQRAFRKAQVDNPLQVVANVEDALSYFNGHGKFADRVQFPLPDLVLLDLKLPGRDGFELLGWVRGNDQLRKLPLVAVTSCVEPSEVAKAYALGANSLVVKPIDFDELVKMVKTLRDYWFATCKVPDAACLNKELPHQAEPVAVSNENEGMALAAAHLHANT